jgi:adenylylsulfate kinase
MTENIFPVNSTVNSDVREKTYNQKAVLIWLTGLSGSGKTTIGKEAERN